MLDSELNQSGSNETGSNNAANDAPPAVTTTRRRAAGRPAGPPVAVSFQAPPPGVAPALPKPERDAEDDAPPKKQQNKQGGQQNQQNKNQQNKKQQNQQNKKDEPAKGPSDAADSDSDDDDAPKRRRRSRGGRRRRKSDGDTDDVGTDNTGTDDADDSDEDGDSEAGTSTRRRRRRARAGEAAAGSPDDPENTVVKVRQGRTAEDEITGVTGSTRLEAKKQRRREGREAGRRRAPIVSEAEFLARRESVKRDMVVRQRADYTQIAVLEDGVLVEHYVARESQTSLIGNVYLGKVQNVLPSMEAAFIDIGAGRNAVLYAGEVDWSTLANGKARKIEDALTPGQSVLVQVTKDPIGQKGARLTSQVSLPGRFMVLVPHGNTSGISRKLPDVERTRLKTLLKDVLPEDTGFIVRTAAEGASEDQLTRDVTALTARWSDIESKVKAGRAPDLLYAEPDLMIKVIRDLFNEDFNSLVVEGADAWDMVKGYLDHVAPDLSERVSRWEDSENFVEGKDSFAGYRIDEQIHKALDRKVHLPSGGSLVIDRTEAMTVVDVNTGKYTGSGGNLEETVTKNNLEAAEEVVRQLRLRDIGGIIVVDFIDMVLESNRDLVLRRLVECLGRDRTRHQVAEVTSLGLVQMTRKRIGTGLLEAFSTECEHCKGRGVQIEDHPIEPAKEEPARRGARGNRGGRTRKSPNGGQQADNNSANDTAKDSAAQDSGEGSETDKPEAEKPAEKPAKKPAKKTGTKTGQSGNTQARKSTPKPASDEGDSAPVLTDEGQAP